MSSEFLDGGFTQDVAEWSPPQPGGFPFRNEPCLDYSVPKCTHEVAFCKCGYIFKFHYSQFSDGKYLWEKFCPFCSRPNPHKTEIPKKMNREIFFLPEKKQKKKKCSNTPAPLVKTLQNHMNTNIVAHVRHHMGGLTWNLLFLTLWMEDCDVFKETAKKHFSTRQLKMFFIFTSPAHPLFYFFSLKREKKYTISNGKTKLKILNFSMSPQYY